MATPRINVLSPDGQEGTIPQSQVQQAGVKGYRAVMYDKSGQRGSVPFEQMPQATRSGYTTTPPTQFEQERTPKGSAAWRAAKAAGTDVLGAVAGLGSMFSNPAGSNLSQAAQIGRQYGEEKAAGYSPLYRGASLLGSATGIINPEGMEDAATHGDTAGVAGHLALPLASGTLAIPKVREGIGNMLGAASEARGRIGESIRTPEGKLKTIPKATAQVAGGVGGAALGAPLGHEYVGAAAGYKLGPTLLESFFPDPNAELRARGAFMNKGYRPAVESASVGGGPLGKTRLGETSGQAGATGSAEGPFAPLVWESPEEAAAHDLRMKNLGRQAHDAGVYSAAQGATKRKLNYQQRIGRKELQ